MARDIFLQPFFGDELPQDAIAAWVAPHGLTHIQTGDGITKQLFRPHWRPHGAPVAAVPEDTSFQLQLINQVPKIVGHSYPLRPLSRISQCAVCELWIPCHDILYMWCSELSKQVSRPRLARHRQTHGRLIAGQLYRGQNTGILDRVDALALTDGSETKYAHSGKWDDCKCDPPTSSVAARCGHMCVAKIGICQAFEGLILMGEVSELRAPASKIIWLRAGEPAEFRNGNSAICGEPKTDVFGQPSRGRHTHPRSEESRSAYWTSMPPTQSSNIISRETLEQLAEGYQRLEMVADAVEAQAFPSLVIPPVLPPRPHPYRLLPE